MSIPGLVSRIEVAFADVAKPAMTLDGLLDEQAARDDLSVTAFVGCRADHWTEVDPAVIEAEEAALTAFNPKAFLFFLPAYMRHVLLTNGGSEVTDSVIYFLDCGRADAVRQWQMNRFELLSRDQSRAVACFLESAANGVFEADSDAAMAALENYWKAAGQARDDVM